MSSINDVHNKLKQLPHTRINQLLVTLGLIYIASTMANITWMVLPADASAGGFTPVGAADTRTTKSSAQSFNISTFTALNVFGQYVIKTVANDKADAQKDVIPLTGLDLTLTATVAEDTNGQGTAVIASDGLQATYGISDKINSSAAIVKQVFVDRVIIQNGEKTETLMLDGLGQGLN